MTNYGLFALVAVLPAVLVALLTFVIVLVLPPAVLVLTFMFVIGVEVAIGVAALTLRFMLALALALLAGASPQAIPSALKPKTVESAITFFITELILLSSSKIKFTLFLPRPRDCGLVPNIRLILEHWTI